METHILKINTRQNYKHLTSTRQSFSMRNKKALTDSCLAFQVIDWLTVAVELVLLSKQSSF